MSRMKIRNKKAKFGPKMPINWRFFKSVQHFLTYKKFKGGKTLGSNTYQQTYDNKQMRSF